MKFKAIPITLTDANAFVKKHHRHSIPTRGHKFSVGCELEGVLVGVAICGRPIARLADTGRTLEILRVATDGTKHANSFLYGLVKRIARQFGFDKIITYTLESESGSSLRAVGAKPESKVRAAEWSRPSRGRQSQKVYKENKIRWKL